MPKERRSTKHHIIPKSRGGKRRKGNIKKRPYGEHNAFHSLFYIKFKSKKINLLPCEAINIIKINWTGKLGELDKSKLTPNQLISWGRLFENFSIEEAVQKLTQEWTREKCFQFKECLDFSNPKKICPLLKKRGS